MQKVSIICVGKMKEKFYIDAAAEYVKRLSRFCKLEIVELPEDRLPDDPSQAQIDAALAKEAEAIRAKLPASAYIIAMCVEGKTRSSEELARLMAEAIRAKLPASAYIIAMCVEGKTRSSEELARLMAESANQGGSHLIFLIGGSFGLHPSVKALAAVKLSMSPMTFPHHLARVMLLEQIYRGYQINAGSKYHK